MLSVAALCRDAPRDRRLVAIDACAAPGGARTEWKLTHEGDMPVAPAVQRRKNRRAASANHQKRSSSR